MTNYPLGSKFDATYQKLQTKIYQWLDNHSNGVFDDIFCIPQLFEMQYTHE